MLVILPDELSPTEPPREEDIPKGEEGVALAPTSKDMLPSADKDGEILAKKIVTDILDRSIKRLVCLLGLYLLVRVKEGVGGCGCDCGWGWGGG